MSTYPTPAGHRLAIDEDGTLLFKITSGNAVTQLSQADLVTLNNENDDSINAENKIALYFPTPRTISSFFLATFASSVITFEYSEDTTNFIDGTWNTIASPGSSASVVNPNYRSGLLSAGISNVKAIRLTTNQTIYKALHVYGFREFGDHLDFCDGFGNPLADSHLDFGDSIVAMSEDRKVHVVNQSATDVAEDVVVTAEILTDSAAPSIPAQFLFSLDSNHWYATAEIGDLAPGMVSPPIYVRRVTPTNAVLGLWAPRLQAQAALWSEV